MKNYWKSFLAFIIIYIIFWLVMWLWAIPSTMWTGMSVAPYYVAISVWLAGSIIIPIAFIIIFYLQWRKRKITLA